MSDAEKDVLESARDWIRQRDDYKALLLTELAEARKRVDEIEATLAELGSPRASESTEASVPSRGRPSKTRRGPSFVASKATLGDVVLNVLESHPEGLRAGQIVKAVVALRPDAKPTTVYPTIYRMRDSDRIRHHGKKYLSPVDKEAAE